MIWRRRYSVRHINEAGLELIKSFEGCRLTAYKAVPSEQYYTIGWGHYGADVTVGMVISQEQADDMLRADLERYEGYVSSTSYCPITDELNDNQFSALVSFCYNCGEGSLKTLCAGRTEKQISEKMPMYNRSGGNVLAGLVRRRAAEVELFNTPVIEEEEMTKEEFYTLFAESMDRYRAELAGKEPSDWAEAEIREAMELGITDGTRPQDICTRQEAILMIKRAVDRDDK